MTDIVTVMNFRQVLKEIWQKCVYWLCIYSPCVYACNMRTAKQIWIKFGIRKFSLKIVDTFQFCLNSDGKNQSNTASVFVYIPSVICWTFTGKKNAVNKRVEERSTNYTKEVYTLSLSPIVFKNHAPLGDTKLIVAIIRLTNSTLRRP
jgi:hypothetical protein